MRFALEGSSSGFGWFTRFPSVWRRGKRSGKLVGDDGAVVRPCRPSKAPDLILFRRKTYPGRVKLRKFKLISPPDKARSFHCSYAFFEARMGFHCCTKRKRKWNTLWTPLRSFWFLSRRKYSVPNLPLWQLWNINSLLAEYFCELSLPPNRNRSPPKKTVSSAEMKVKSKFSILLESFEEFYSFGFV